MDVAAADALIGRGQALEDAGDLAGAERAFREAVERAPAYPRAHINLGNVLEKDGRLAAAAAAHRRAIEIEPGYAPGHFNLGKALLALREARAARGHFETALALRPDMADAAVMIASACEMEGDLEGARRHLEQAIALEPSRAGVVSNLGFICLQAGRLADARSAFTRALQAEPDSVAGRIGMGLLEVFEGHAERAQPHYLAALARDPLSISAWGLHLFALNLRGDVDAQTVAREHFRFGDAMAPFASSAPAKAPRKPGRIRVGYVSGDLVRHPVAHFLLPVLDAHDRTAFEVFCYSTRRAEDAMTATLRGRVEHWRSLDGRDDEEAAQAIRADGIDVLVDLSGHTEHNRLGVFARRAAPVQATWLGYLNTTGLVTMDYRICDAYTDPPGMSEALNREALARMPDSQWCYVPHAGAPAAMAPQPANAAPTFGSFNQFAKLSDACLAIWGEVLRAVPEALLRVHAVPRGMEDDFLARLAAQGIARERVTLLGRMPTADYLAAIAGVDLALDAFPYNGGTTTLDTLWMGTPLVAWAGERALSRSSYSIASAAGLDELVVRSRDQYVQRNAALARDAAARLALRRSLRTRLEASALMDVDRFTRHLEAFYRQAVERI